MLKIILNISSNIPSIRININKIENVITFKIKAGYLELLKHKTTKLLGRTEKNENENDENFSHFRNH